MKVLIVYESVSPMKLTAKIAKTIGEVLKEKGIEIDSFHVADVNKIKLENYNCLLVGGPTMKFRATKKIRDFVDGLSSADSLGRLAAAFDTQVKSRLSGNAAKGIENKLKNLGFKIVMDPLIAYVDGKLTQNEWYLKEGEIEKAKKWGQAFAEALLK
jgi:flavodoxin